MSLSTSQELGIVITQKISSSLSMMGSAFILQEVVRDSRKRSKIFYRLLASMSVCDILSSIWMFIGTWAVPRDTPNVYQAFGNHATCQTQAFFINASVTTLSFNACLSLYYMLSIQYGWRAETFRHFRVEAACYIYAIGVGLVVCFMGLLRGVFGPANFWCSVRPSNQTKNAWLAWYIPAWFVLGFVTLTMTSTYAHVWRIEHKGNKYNFAADSTMEHSGRLGTCQRLSTPPPPCHRQETPSTRPHNNSTSEEEGGDMDASSRRNFNDNDIHINANRSINPKLSRSQQRKQQNQKNKHSKRVAVQAVFYCLAFYLTLIPPTIVRTHQAISHATTPPPYPLLVLHMLFLPLQGFMNFLVYMRLRWHARLQKYVNTSGWCGCCVSVSSKSVILRSLLFSSNKSGEDGSNNHHHHHDNDNNNHHYDNNSNHHDNNNQRGGGGEHEDELSDSGVECAHAHKNDIHTEEDNASNDEIMGYYDDDEDYDNIKNNDNDNMVMIMVNHRHECHDEDRKHFAHELSR